jgi:hypothetical protein
MQDGVAREFRIEPGAADIELNRTHVVWRLDQVKATESSKTSLF